MGNFNIHSMKGAVIGIFATVILILIIPLLIVVSQERQTLHGRTPEPTPAIVLSTISGQASIAGYVYHDTNRDGERKEEEKPFKDVTIRMKVLKENGQEDKTLTEIKTDSYGYFSFRFPVDGVSSYMIKVVIPQGYQTVTSNPVIISDLKPNAQKIVEFGLAPSGDVPIPSPTRKITPKPTVVDISPTP